jgi:hypothetical protein
VVIFLELSVAHIVNHAKKYPQPILAVAIPAFVTKKSPFAGVTKECAEAVGS